MDEMNQTPASPNTTPPAPSSIPMNAVLQKPQTKGHMGAISAIILIIAILAFGGWYYISQIQNADTLEQDMQDQAAVENLQTQGTSDELSDIEADVTATDLSGLDGASSDVDADLTQ